MKRVVRDVMTTRVATAHPDAPFKEIARLMVENRVSALPVVVSTDGIVGIVSEGDLILKEDPDPLPVVDREGKLLGIISRRTS